MDDERLYQRRQGFWLRMARERAGKSQQGAAEYLGLSAKSKSTISDYENGVTAVPLWSLRRLSVWYGVPLELFTHPRQTVEEQIDEIVRAAGALEREDQAAAEAVGDQGAEGEPAGGRRTRSA
ncbi:MAG: Helix-turn-helix domain [Chloroflexota bacterium]|jgi:transcriptional regulator with XRE-family HTH domain|nr:Helix-turn-helix domain [Chloroflexota bacterium]